MKKIATLACLLAAGMLAADTTPVMVSLVTPVQAPNRNYDVTGFRLSLIYGECQEFAGLDIGVIDNSRKDFTGLVLGGLNFVGERLYGAQVGLANWNGNGDTTWERRSVGAQVGILNYADTFCGLQSGFLNISGESFMGLQASLINCAHDLYGLQCGSYLIIGVNVASGTVRGCQIGLVNYANTIERGCQIGLLNIISQNGWLPVLPIVNGHF
ncbi:MAG: hypothetical protein IJI36_03415 [Kiritimatiellae bacterium]|nr:hypothetical protein [Kiritimatiellia bacterium]